MQEIVHKQKEFFNSGATLSIAFRREQLKRLKHALRSHETAMYEAIYSDFKKSEFDTFTSELGMVYREIEDALRNLPNWSRKQPVRNNLINFPGKSYVLPQPLGVSLIIGAWNYPYLLCLTPMIAAIASGCTVVLKPSELPALTSKMLAKIISECFSEVYITVVEGGVTETTELLRHPFDKIFFTGSTTVGKIVYKAAAENLVPVTLELGGKSPAFVTSECNLKLTVKRLIWSKFLNAGQTCIAPDYVLVERSIEQKFLALGALEIQKENISFENGNYTQIINQRNFDRLTGYLESANVYFGGATDASQRYIAPTLLQQVSFEDPVMQEEIFGPILPVIAYDTLDDAIARVKSLPSPLACYVFTRKKTVQKRIMHELSFGGGMINDAVAHITNGRLPFGGIGPSGFGSYHGEAGFRAFSHYKGIIEKSNWLELPLKYYPHTKRKLWWIKKFFKF